MTFLDMNVFGDNAAGIAERVADAKRFLKNMRALLDRIMLVLAQTQQLVHLQHQQTYHPSQNLLKSLVKINQ